MPDAPGSSTLALIYAYSKHAKEGQFPTAKDAEEAIAAIIEALGQGRPQ